MCRALWKLHELVITKIPTTKILFTIRSFLVKTKETSRNEINLHLQKKKQIDTFKLIKNH